MNTTFSYKEAIEQYLNAIQGTRSIPSQPDKSLSTRRGRTWRLFNTNGLLAIVTNDGEVLFNGEIEDSIYHRVHVGGAQ